MAQGRKTIPSNFTSLLLDCFLFRILVERVKPVNTGNSPFQGGNPPWVDGPLASFMIIKRLSDNCLGEFVSSRPLIRAIVLRLRLATPVLT